MCDEDECMHEWGLGIECVSLSVCEGVAGGINITRYYTDWKKRNAKGEVFLEASSL
jgi:hypothetical protein